MRDYSEVEYNFFSQALLYLPIFIPHVENITDTKNFTIFQFYIIKATILILQVVILYTQLSQWSDPRIFGNGAVKLAIEKDAWF